MDYLVIVEQAKDPTLTWNQLSELMSQIHSECKPKLWKYNSLSSPGTSDISAAGLSSERDLDRQKLNTLKDCRIYLSSPEDFNDPFDCKGFFYDKSRMGNVSNRDSAKGRNYSSLLRIASLTAAGYQNMPMWAHYANNHQGFCVEYDMEDHSNRVLASYIYRVQYGDVRADISELLDRWIGLIHQEKGGSGIFLSFMFTLLCCIKNKTWSYEQEYRCIVNNFNLETVKIRAVPSAIYVGAKCHPFYRKELVSIGEAIGVRVYEMTFDNLSESYELRASQLR